MVRVPGYEVLELLGRGGTGEVWRAIETAGGDVVAIKRMAAGTSPADRDRLRREGALLAALRHPHVIGLRAVVGTPDGVALVLDHAAGGSLAGVLAARGRLEPGEVVTVAVALADALDAAHARGLVHGDVTPGNVLFAADGRPLLSDLGVSRLVGEPGGRAEATTGYADPAGCVDAAGDVYALAAVCWDALVGTDGTVERSPLQLVRPDVPAALARAVHAGLTADPAARPSAAGFADAVAAACPALPVTLPHRTPAALQQAQTRPVAPAVPAAVVEQRPRRRWLRPVVAAVGALLLAVGGGWTWGAATSTAEGRRLSPAAAPDWERVVADLLAARTRVLAAPDPADLDAIYVAGTEVARRERAVVERLAGRGWRAEGLEHRALDVRVLEAADQAVTVRVLDALSSYDVVDGAGAVVGGEPDRGALAWRVELRLTPRGWRIAAVDPVT